MNTHKLPPKRRKPILQSKKPVYRKGEVRKEWIGDWDKADEIFKKWDEMHKRLGLYGMADLLIKTPSWRAYDQRWPFDNMATWDSNSDIVDYREEAKQPSIEEEVGDRLLTEELIRNLSPRQKKIFEAIRDGQSSVEIEIEQGYNTNIAVRWHKHQIKKKYKSLKADNYEKIFEFVCRDCGNVFEGKKIESPCPSCDSKDTLFTKQHFKPVF
jgi:predicted Zn-ribbon and HTH transcriptional regulator